jgi:hypothetical protein
VRGGQSAPPLQFTLAPDRPPCMDGFLPPVGLLYLLDRSQPFTFQVTEVLDDLDPFPGRAAPSTAIFRWSLWRELDPAWRALPTFDQNALTIDPSRFAIDELVQVRVEAGDRVARTPSTCDASALLCGYATAWPGVPSCYPNRSCEAWATWQARFR